MLVVDQPIPPTTLRTPGAPTARCGRVQDGRALSSIPGACLMPVMRLRHTRRHLNPSLCPATVYGLLHAPVPEGRLMLCIQEVLREACRLSHIESLAFTNHSARHALQCSSAVGDEPDACRHEMGKWSSSTAQLDAMRPTANILQCHTFRLAHIPDLYSQDARPAAAARVLHIMYRQVERLRTYVTLCGGPTKVPKFMDWNTLPKFQSSGSPADE